MKFKNRVILIVTVLLLVICGVTAYNLWPKTGDSPTQQVPTELPEEFRERTGLLQAGSSHDPTGSKSFLPSKP